MFIEVQKKKKKKKNMLKPGNLQWVGINLKVQCRVFIVYPNKYDKTKIYYN